MEKNSSSPAKSNLKIELSGMISVLKYFLSSQI